MTITEGLQEIKTLIKRIDKKRTFIEGYILRNNQIRDPHESSGGSQKLIKQELQGIIDLEENIISIRRKIAAANTSTTVTIGETTKSIADWIIWRREIAHPRKRFLEKLLNKILSARKECASAGLRMTELADSAAVSDIIVNVNEKSIADEIEAIENILSTLDGQLSLKNATIAI